MAVAATTIPQRSRLLFLRVPVAGDAMPLPRLSTDGPSQPQNVRREPRPTRAEPSPIARAEEYNAPPRLYGCHDNTLMGVPASCRLRARRVTSLIGRRRDRLVIVSTKAGRMPALL